MFETREEELDARTVLLEECDPPCDFYIGESSISEGGVMAFPGVKYVNTGGTVLLEERGRQCDLVSHGESWMTHCRRERMLAGNAWGGAFPPSQESLQLFEATARAKNEG